MSRIVDLSMPVHRDMVTFPRINPPQMLMFDSWEDFARGVGADKYGVDMLTASYTIIQSDHAGTHMDAVKHIRPDAPGASEIPLEYCYSDGVVLDFRHKEYGAGISAAEIDEALEKIGYTLRARFKTAWPATGIAAAKRRWPVGTRSCPLGVSTATGARQVLKRALILPSGPALYWIQRLCNQASP